MPNHFLSSLLRVAFNFTGRFYLAAFAINIITWLVLWKIAVSGVPDAVLHYNVAYGVDLVDSSAKVFLLPTTGIVIIFANILLSLSSHKSSVARRLPAVMSFVTSVLLLFASWLLIRFVL